MSGSKIRKDANYGKIICRKLWAFRFFKPLTGGANGTEKNRLKDGR